MSSLFKKHFILTSLLSIFLFGIFLRFYQLSAIPNGFHIDEAIGGVNGYFLLQTGRDSNNIKFPLQTEVFGDDNPTGYSYLTMLPIKLFGLNEFSTRFPGALLGSLTIPASYLLAFSVFRSRKVGLLSAFLMAISPWHIVLSRSSEETLVALFFVVLGFALVLLSLENKKIKFLILGILSLAVSFFVYFTSRVFVPLFLLSFAVYVLSHWRKQGNIRYKVFFIFSFLLLSSIVSFLVFGIKGGENRFNQVSVFGSLGTKLIMEEQIREDGVTGTSVGTTRFFHNKLINYSLAYVSNYVDYFSGSFLFIKGGLPVWFSVDNMGLIYLVELPFLLIGFIMLVVSKNKMHKVPLLWLAIAPVVAAITIDDIPNIRRSFIMLPILEIISAFGFLHVLKNREKLSKGLIISFSIAFLAFNFLYFSHQYFTHEPIHKNWYRNEGFDEMVKFVKNSYNDVDKIVVTKDAGGIYPLVLFYMQYDPKIYLSEGSPKDKDYTGFGKFFFVPQACPSVDGDNRFPKGKLMYIDNGTCSDRVALNNRKKTYVSRKDGTRVFRIVYD